MLDAMRAGLAARRYLAGEPVTDDEITLICGRLVELEHSASGFAAETRRARAMMAFHARVADRLAEDLRLNDPRRPRGGASNTTEGTP